MFIFLMIGLEKQLGDKHLTNPVKIVSWYGLNTPVVHETIFDVGVKFALDFASQKIPFEVVKNEGKFWEIYVESGYEKQARKIMESYSQE